ncbi:MAG: thiopurine S-methyltransferase [Thiotrichaceae bacterium]|nr:thiopurine S-methyltransferase [Thiotrichaceae bacterium]
MESTFWYERWKQGQIGFHGLEVNTWLIKYWPHVTKSMENKKVFVPLCGKTLDMLWLQDEGYEVIGCEISPIAVQDFFSHNKLEVSRTIEGEFEVWQSGNITLYCGDFFALKPEQLEGCGIIYDRASLIALPESMRNQYAKHLLRLAQPQKTQILLITLEYDQEKMSGPPFSVSTEQINDYYQQHFTIECLSSKDVLNEAPNFKKRGLTHLTENVLLLS